jgi:hypothetical protein
VLPLPLFLSVAEAFAESGLQNQAEFLQMLTRLLRAGLAAKAKYDSLWDKGRFGRWEDLECLVWRDRHLDMDGNVLTNALSYFGPAPPGTPQPRPRIIWIDLQVSREILGLLNLSKEGPSPEEKVRALMRPELSVKANVETARPKFPNMTKGELEAIARDMTGHRRRGRPRK